MKKIVRIGAMDCCGHKASIFCKVSIEDEKLSVSGVIGPRANGDAWGGCGQIDMEFEHRKPEDNDRRYSKLVKPSEISFAPGWSADLWLDFLDMWHRWHLNDMRANCEHQTGPEWDTGRELVIYHFRLTKEVDKAVRDAKHRAQECIEKGKTFTPSTEETRLANLPDKITHHRATLPPNLAKGYTANGPQYDKDSYNRASETKTAGWVNPSEHPGGLLLKPCPVCGYKYGSAWRKVQLPPEVGDFIAKLPDADIQPAWV